MAKKSGRSGTEGRLAGAHRRYGWTALLLWLLFGTLLEFFQGIKFSPYLLDEIRSEFWQLAHFHGATLALANLVYVRYAESPELDQNQRLWASRLLIWGSILMPVGFFLGGLIHFEGDPGLGIFIAPVGALFILITVAFQAVAAWTSR